MQGVNAENNCTFPAKIRQISVDLSHCLPLAAFSFFPVVLVAQVLLFPSQFTLPLLDIDMENNTWFNASLGF